MKLSEPKAILIDLDGVLLDTEHLNGEAWRLTALHFGVKLNKKQLKLLLGRTRKDCANDILAIVDKRITLSDLFCIHLPIQRKLLKDTRAINYAEPLIELITKKGIKTALVTSSGKSSVNFKISLHPWINMISEKIMGDDPCLKNGKPSPAPYLLAAYRLGVNTEKCWAIEDSDSGIKSALKAGCKVWALNPKKGINEFDKNPIFTKNLKTILRQIENIKD